jgi:hypothetical protein
MKNAALYAILFISFIACSCIRKPHRPDAPLCTVDEIHGECTDARGDFFLDHAHLLCTSLEGYSTLERYIDELELRVKQLERRCKN